MSKEVKLAISLFRDILEPLEDALVKMTDTYQCDEFNTISDDYLAASTYFEDLKQAYPDSIRIEFQNNDGVYHDSVEAIDSKWAIDDIGQFAGDDDDIDEEAYLNHIGHLRFTLQGFGYTIELYVSLDGIHYKWFTSYLIFKGRGLVATFLTEGKPCANRRDFIRFPPGSSGLMGVDPGCDIKNNVYSVTDCEILRKVFELSDDDIALLLVKK